jgi:hypothetical protein
MKLTKQNLLWSLLFGGKGKGGITPSGAIDITSNGNDIDVAEYATANVNVPASAVVSGTKQITANGTNIDVTDYAAVDVNVSSSGPTLTPVKITNNNTGKNFTAHYMNSTGAYESIEFLSGSSLTVYAPATGAYYKARTALVALYNSAGGLGALTVSSRGVWCPSSDGMYAAIVPKNITSANQEIIISS